MFKLNGAVISKSVPEVSQDPEKVQLSLSKKQSPRGHCYLWSVKILYTLSCQKPMGPYSVGIHCKAIVLVIFTCNG